MNKVILRAGANELVMGNAMSLQQHWEWRTTWHIPDILNNQLFNNCRASLWSGDSITICRYDGWRDDRGRGATLLECANIRVTYVEGKLEKGDPRKGVGLFLWGEVAILPQIDVPEPKETGLTRHWKGGSAKFAIVDAHGAQVAEGLEKDQADHYVKTGVPPG